jgi:hypothetical protein
MMATLAAWRRERASLRRRGRWDNRARSLWLVRGSPPSRSSSNHGRRGSLSCCSVAMGGNRRVAAGEAVSSWSEALGGAVNGVTSSCCAFDPGEGRRLESRRRQRGRAKLLSHVTKTQAGQKTGVRATARTATSSSRHVCRKRAGYGRGSKWTMCAQRASARWILTWVGPQGGPRMCLAQAWREQRRPARRSNNMSLPNSRPSLRRG